MNLMAGGNQHTDSASSELQRLFADEWEFRMREDPTFATLCGDHRFDDRLPSVSEADSQRRMSQARTFLERLQAIDQRALSPEDRLNYRIFEQEIENQVAGYEFHTDLTPITKLGGPHILLAELQDFAPFETATDYENYIARLNAFKAYVRDNIELMRIGMQKGYTAPQVVLQGIEDSFQAHLVEAPTRSVFHKPFEQFPSHIGEADRRRLVEAGRAAITHSVVPGYQELLKFIPDEYRPAARTDIAAASLPNGRAFYEHCVRKHTTLDLTPQEIHDIGLAEVQRIRGEMDAIVHQVGFQGDFHQFVNFLRTDGRFYADTPDMLMKEVALILKKMDGELPRLFKKLPRTPYGIREIPDAIAPGNTTAYYFPPTGDGTRAGFYYVNTHELKSRPLYEIEALSLHEAVPGHHLHIALQMELGEIPNFRRFGWITAFGEGWALYAERLGLEVGFYQDPYHEFGRLTYEMWRACRLVVDTGIHSLGWTRAQAIDFMAENTALALLNITNEVDRYIVMPGQALAYKIGELKIRELRALCEQTLGASFDVREFHGVVLDHGVIPLDVLEAHVRSWLVEKAPRSHEDPSGLPPSESESVVDG